MWRCKAGFTLIEVLVVATVIAVLLTIAIPNYMTWLPGMRLKAASRDLFSHMQQVRLRAVKENRNFAIEFDVAGNRFFLLDDYGDDRIPNSGDLTENDGNCSANEIMDTIDLSTYGSGIVYGSGAAPLNLVTYVGNKVTFDPQGFGNAAGYAHFTNEDNVDAFRVGTSVNGGIRLQRWTGADYK